MSKPLVVTIPHELGRAEARRRIEGGVGRLTGQLGAIGELKQAWDGDLLRFSLAAVGQTVSGVIAVEEREVRVEIVLPGVLGLIAGKVQSRMRQEGLALLSGPKRG